MWVHLITNMLFCWWQTFDIGTYSQFCYKKNLKARKLWGFSRFVSTFVNTSIMFEVWQYLLKEYGTLGIAIYN